MTSVLAGHEKELEDVISNDILKSGEVAQIDASAELLFDLRKMVNDPTFSDVIFVCKGGVRVHALRKLLSGRSNVLNKMLTNGMVESSLSEIELPEISSSEMLCVLEFLYTGTLVDYPIFGWAAGSATIIVARFFLLPNLEKIARKIVHESPLYKSLEKVASLLVVAIGSNASFDEIKVNLKELVIGVEENWLSLSILREFSKEELLFIVGNSKGKSDLLYVRNLSEDAFLYLHEISKGYPRKCDLHSFEQMIRWCRYQSDCEVRTRVKMEVCVKTLFGKAITLEVESSSTVDKVKRKIQKQLGNPPNQQQLCDSHSRKLEDLLTLDHYGIVNGSTLTVTFLSKPKTRPKRKFRDFQA